MEQARSKIYLHYLTAQLPMRRGERLAATRCWRVTGGAQLMAEKTPLTQDCLIRGALGSTQTGGNKWKEQTEPEAQHPQGPPSAPRDASHNRNALKLALIADGLDTRTGHVGLNAPRLRIAMQRVGDGCSRRYSSSYPLLTRTFAIFDAFSGFALVARVTVDGERELGAERDTSTSPSMILLWLWGNRRARNRRLESEKGAQAGAGETPRERDAATTSLYNSSGVTGRVLKDQAKYQIT
ncbi:hypothetical protein B0H14DRAFT_2613566 [Mycena olivaceomarginata]|nr:hypothetical protein B0H14DRAFT_2613566 [Mycena olivaceomarginata]